MNNDGDDSEKFGLVLPMDPTKKGKRKAAPKAAGAPPEVTSYSHPDQRLNIPEVGLVRAENDPEQPKTVWKYDPHLDPSLQFDVGRAAVETLIDDALESGDAENMRAALAELKRLGQPYLAWAGKAERTSFEVDTVSLHVHERIDPARVLAAVKKAMVEPAAPAQPGLFDAPFKPVPLTQALDFYRHPLGWANRLVAGDSLLVMNSLLQKESMAGQVQMIYFDPPYGIKFGSNFQPFTGQRDVKDGADADLTQEPEMIKAFRDTWELGIHSFLTYLRDRLLLARDLLHDSGSIFVQIGDENEHRVRMVMDEVFGAKNFVSVVAVKKTTGQTSDLISGALDFIIWYAKDVSKIKYHEIYSEKVMGSAGTGEYQYLRLPNGGVRRLTADEFSGSPVQPAERIFSIDNLTSQKPPGDFPVRFNGLNKRPGAGYWKTGESQFPRLLKSQRVSETKNSLKYVRYLDDFPVMALANYWDDLSSGASSADKKIYIVQTAARVIQRCVLMTTDPGDLVLDPTCGSGTTAFVAEDWGRRWITCDTSRVAVTLAKQRLMTASYDYYTIRHPVEGLRGGFVYKTVRHVQLKDIANNAEIDEIFERLHPAIDTALAALNAGLAGAPPFTPILGVRKGKKVDFAKGEIFHEWEVPFDWPETWPAAARPAFDGFHAARQAMQKVMDKSIADHAESETLYDKPEIDTSKLRVTGPFTVEAVPSPAVVSLDENAPSLEADAGIARQGETSRQALWRDELMKTGIRGKGGQKIRLGDIETVPGMRYLHASASDAETGERIVISFGPEYAALDQRQVERAMSDAMKLVPQPKKLVFCAFAFDPEAAKDIEEINWPGVMLLKAQMNSDLLTEDLKKARSTNESFWLIGQPDVEVRKRKDADWEVEVRGFDYFDTAKNELISGGRGDIAMWSLDSDYDGRSLYPTQSFFPMAGDKDGWNRLKRTIRAELDEDLLAAYHGTVSLPFAAGKHKRIAVKIVDTRGIESLKIVDLDD